MKKFMCKICGDESIERSGYCFKHEKIRLELIKNIIQSFWWEGNKKHYSLIENYSIDGLNEIWRKALLFDEKHKKIRYPY
jgi:hypothetical protein